MCPSDLLWPTRRCAVRLAVDLREDFTDHVLGVHLEVEEGLVVRDRCYPFIRLELWKNGCFSRRQVKKGHADLILNRDSLD